jgi:hypothetical protein
LALTTPRELGGSGGAGTNPEQLFAAGYSSCFLGALKFVTARDKLPFPADTEITGIVGIGPMPTSLTSSPMPSQRLLAGPTLGDMDLENRPLAKDLEVFLGPEINCRNPEVRKLENGKRKIGSGILEKY